MAKKVLFWGQNIKDRFTPSLFNATLKRPAHLRATSRIFGNPVLQNVLCFLASEFGERVSNYMSTDYSDVRKHAKSRPIGPSLPIKGPYELGLKRLFDVMCVVASIPFILPLIGVLALMVKRDGGPAFYCQDRVGMNGRIYRIWKLRTMVVDAESKLQDHLSKHPEAAAEWTLTQKLKRDPRITKIGALLRKSSVDELPQLWNVLIGDMSLVGPRPMLPEQQTMYPGLAYYSQRPGITGSWQVSDRNECTFADRARFDTDYIANMSFANDMKLLLATVRVVVRGTGY
jgi:lipopolysaccharide/colanic/teichoic acid biosynthesis glycosyltransferase